MSSKQYDMFNVDMHVNSLKVYKDKVAPTLMGRKLEVYNAIVELGGEATLWEIGQHLNLPLNCISGRPGELKKMNMIEASEKNKEHHGNQFTIWKIKTSDDN